MALTQEDRQRGAQASAAAKRRRILERSQQAEIVDVIINELGREELGPKFLKLAAHIAERAGDAAVPVETALEVKQLMEAAALAHKMGRLELGESTANTAVVNVTDAFAKQRELDARLAKLRDGDVESQG